MRLREKEKETRYQVRFAEGSGSDRRRPAQKHDNPPRSCSHSQSVAFLGIHICRVICILWTRVVVGCAYRGSTRGREEVGFGVGPREKRQRHFQRHSESPLAAAHEWPTSTTESLLWHTARAESGRSSIAYLEGVSTQAVAIASSAVATLDWTALSGAKNIADWPEICFSSSRVGFRTPEGRTYNDRVRVERRKPWSRTGDDLGRGDRGADQFVETDHIREGKERHTRSRRQPSQHLLTLLQLGFLTREGCGPAVPERCCRVGRGPASPVCSRRGQAPPRPAARLRSPVLPRIRSIKPAVAISEYARNEFF